MANNWAHDLVLVDTLTDSLLKALPFFTKRLVRTDEIVRTRHIPFSQIQILILLQDGALSVGDLSARLGIAKPNVTPLVDHLVEVGFVERRRNTEDRRIVQVELCDKGREELKAIRQAIRDQVLTWEKRYTRSEARDLNASIQRIYQIMTGA